MSVTYHICVSDVVISDKKEADHDTIWKTMHPVSVSLSGLRQYIETGHPFLCCKQKHRWNGQQLFCIDIDHFELARGRYTFDEYITILDALGLPPCLAYTTFGNPERKRERFRLLFQLTEPVTKLEQAKKISRFLYGILNELIPGTPDKACVSPYHLFYPGKKVILYRSDKSARTDMLSDVIQELEKPKAILKTTWAWNKMKQILEKDPFIPSITWGDPPPGYLIILGTEPWISEYHKDIKTSLGIFKLSLLESNRLSYNLTLWEKIIDKYYNIQGALEQSKQKMGTRSITGFEHYQGLLSHVLSGCLLCYNDYSMTLRQLLWKHKTFVFQAMGIRILPNTPMVLPTRYAQYAKAVLDLSAYPNLSRLFQRDLRKQQVLASIILAVRDIAVTQKPFRTVPQYIVTYETVADKLRKKFKESISKNGLTKWMKQFDALHLIHICQQDEICEAIKTTYPNHIKRPTVIQVPYFDSSVLVHAENLAARYKPAPEKIHDEKYTATKIMLSTLLDTRGWFSRDAFLECVRKESSLHNTDGYTEKNAATYFDRYIHQIQQELKLTKSSCTKELMARFPGNHKIGLTKLYYRGDYKCQKS